MLYVHQTVLGLGLGLSKGDPSLLVALVDHPWEI